MSGGRKDKKKEKGLLTCVIALLDDSSYQQVYNRSAPAQDVFDGVCRTLEVLEVEYFGLQYETSAGFNAWLDLTKPLRKQVPAGQGGVVQLEFRVKFFVRNPNQLQDEYTRYLFALQLRRDIYSGRLGCPEDAAAKLLAVLIQGDLGDYDPVEHQGDYVEDIQLIPRQTEELEKNAETHHKSTWCSGLSPADCDYIFVDIARRLPMYGTEKYAMDPSSTGGFDHELAISYEGVSVMHDEEELILFSWSCIRQISYKGKRFILHLYASPAAPVYFVFVASRVCKRLWQYAVEYHTFFRRTIPVTRKRWKQISPFRTGSKYRFSGRTQSQIIQEIRKRSDVVLRSERSISPNFKRYSLSRMSSVATNKRSFPAYDKVPKSPSTLSEFHLVPALTITSASPARSIIAEPSLPSPPEHTQPDSDPEVPTHVLEQPPVGHVKKQVAPTVLKTEPHATKEELTTEERQPAEAASDVHIILVRPASVSPPPDVDRTPMNISPRDGQQHLDRTFSHQLREGEVSDLSELVNRFSTPDPDAMQQDIKPATEKGAGPAPEVLVNGDSVTGEALGSALDTDHDQDDRTPAVSADESCISPPESSLERRRPENKNERHVQHHHSPAVVRPISRASENSLSDSSDDNLTSMSEERRIRALTRRLTRKSKKRPTTKSYYISQELRDTERSYLADLDMLNVKFRNAIQTSGALSEDKTNDLFTHLDNLQEFHTTMLVELENRMVLWEGRSPEHNPGDYCHIGDIMSKRMAEMKIYTPYIKDQTRLLGLVQQWADESAKFRELYSAFEAEQCHLPLLEFFNRPMQRMVHYKLLIGRLIKAYEPNHNDVPNLKMALQHVTDAADYTNRQCRLAENERKLKELQRELSGIEDLMQSGRYLVRDGNLLKVGRSGPRQRHFLLFNDLLLYVAGRALGLPQVKSIIMLREARVEVCDEGNPYGENAFALYTPNKSFFLLARSVKERDSWVEDITSSIEDANGVLDASQSPSVSDLGQISVASNQASLCSSDEVILAAPVLMPFDKTDSCQRCSAEFSFTKRKHHCAGCGRVLCSTCLKHQVVLPFYNNVKKRRVCRDCFEKFQALHKAESREAMATTLQAVSTSVARTPSKSPGSGGDDLTRRDSHEPHYTQSLSSGASAAISHHSLLSMTSGEGSLWSDSASYGSGMMLSVPNGLDQFHRESLAELRESPCEGGLQDAAEEPPHSGEQEGSPGSFVKRRNRAQSMDLHLTRARANTAYKAVTPARRNASLRYDSAKRMRRRHTGILDDEGMVTSVANHMSGHLLCKLEMNEEQRWKRFWVVCTSYSLFFYTTHHETRPVGSMALPDYELGLIEASDGALCELPHSFKLTSETAVNVFVAESQHALDRWMEVIKNCRAGPGHGSTFYV